MTEMANTVDRLKELPVGAVIRVESDDERVRGKILEVVERAHYSTAWSNVLVPARVLWRPEHDRTRSNKQPEES